MDYDKRILEINKEIVKVEIKIKKGNEKANNAIITRNIQLLEEVIKKKIVIINDISNIKQLVDKLQIKVKNINNILCSYINLMKQVNIIRVGMLSLTWRIIKIYDKNTTIVEIIILLKEIVFILSQITKPILIIVTEKKIQYLIKQEKLISSTLTNINNDVHELINIIETKNLNNINNITIEKLEIIEQLVNIKEDENNYISLFITILKKNLLIIDNTKLSIDKIILFTQKIVQNTKTQYKKITKTFTNILSFPSNQDVNKDESNDHYKNRNVIWITKLDLVKKYIDENKNRPSAKDKNKDIKTYGQWIGNQITHYQNKQKIMTDETIRKLWEDFINDDKYKNYFLTNEEEWKLNLEWVKKYINENKKRPTRKNNDEKIYGTWITLQVKNYKNKQQIMTASNIRYLWEDFINEYKIYFK